MNGSELGKEPVTTAAAAAVAIGITTRLAVVMGVGGSSRTTLAVVESEELRWYAVGNVLLLLF